MRQVVQRFLYVTVFLRDPVSDRPRRFRHTSNQRARADIRAGG